jgi:hypothetical protein
LNEYNKNKRKMKRELKAKLGSTVLGDRED